MELQLTTESLAFIKSLRKIQELMKQIETEAKTGPIADHMIWGDFDEHLHECYSELRDHIAHYAVNDLVTESKD